MAKKIIILERMRTDVAVDLKCVFWIDVALANQVPAPFAKSAYLGATIGELAALRSGAVAEVSQRLTWPKGTTAADIRRDLVEKYAIIQADTTAVNVKQFYGAYWDGTSWHAGS